MIYNFLIYSPFSVGILTIFRNDSVDNHRVVVVDFLDNPQWRGLHRELCIAPPEKLKVHIYAPPQHVIIFSQRTMTMAPWVITHFGDVCTCVGLQNPWNQVIFELTSETNDDALELTQEDLRFKKCCFQFSVSIFRSYYLNSDRLLVQG